MDEETKKSTLTYVNVNRANAGYKDKYKKEVDKALLKFANGIGKTTSDDFTQDEWKRFFSTNLLPLDKERERKMISVFSDNRDELNNLLVLHNTLASDNLAEVYYKKYEKESPTKWHDLDDFKQMALEGLAIAAKRFDINSGNKFITYATWWVLNRVRKPNQEKGAMVNHTSFSKPILNSDESDTTFQDVCTPEQIEPDLNYSLVDETNTNPVNVIEKRVSSEDYDLFSSMRKLNLIGGEKIDSKKTYKMMKYLISIVDENKDDYKDKQIFLYMFRKAFKKCAGVLKHFGDEDSRKLSSFISESAKSKSELLSRLNMDEEQFDDSCKNLMRRTYDGEL